MSRKAKYEMMNPTFVSGMSVVLEKYDKDEFDITYDSFQTTQLNQEQINDARCFLSTLGNYCGAGDDRGIQCNTASELYSIWKVEQIKKGVKVCECGYTPLLKEHKEPHLKQCTECKGVRRIKPTLVVNEKKGYGLDLIIHIRDKETKDIVETFVILYGNINYFCNSHNRIFVRQEGDTIDSTATTQMKKSQNRYPFINELKDTLVKDGHLCFEQTINQWTTKFHLVQETLNKAFLMELGISYERFKIDEFGIQCSYEECNGRHVKLIGVPMKKIVRDYEAWKREMKELEEYDENNAEKQGKPRK